MLPFIPNPYFNNNIEVNDIKNLENRIYNLEKEISNLKAKIAKIENNNDIYINSYKPNTYNMM